MNLDDFSKVNNNAMGIHANREQEFELYRKTYDEAQGLIRISEEVRLAVDKVEPTGVKEPDHPASAATTAADNAYDLQGRQGARHPHRPAEREALGRRVP
jgi:hypothetical protein